MQVSVAVSQGLERRLKVVIPSSVVESKYKAKVQDVSRTAKIDGFRPGKVPVATVEKKFGPSIRFEITDELMRENLFEAISQEKLNPAGRPTIESMKAEPNQDLEFEATFEIYPTIELKELTGKEIEKLVATITDQDIDTVLEKLQKQHAEWIDVDRAAKEGDRVMIDFDGYVDDAPINKGKAENVPLILGSKMMIPGFEDAIIGAKPNSEFDITVTFPAEYHEETLKGKPAKFKIKVHGVAEPKLPELNDEFAKRFGVAEGGMDALKNDLRKHMTSELENTLKARNKETVFTAFTDCNEVQLPKVLVENEIEGLHHAAHQHHDHGHDHDHSKCQLTDEERAQYREQAERRVKLGLLVSEIIKKYDLKPDNDKVRKIAENLAGSYENPEEFIRWYFSDKERAAQVQMMAVEDQALEKLLEGAVVKEKTLSYSEAIGAK